MRFGLPDLTIEQIKTCFMPYSDIEWVKIYGSRAKGNYEAGSDIDIAFASPIDHSSQITGALQELPTPYLFDVTHYNSLNNQNLKMHIDRVGQILFTQDDLKK